VQIRIFIFQILGILALVCGYFLSDQPDSLSFMNFNPNPVNPNVITKAIKANGKEVATVSSITSQTNSSTDPKSNEPKYIPLEYMLPFKPNIHFFEEAAITHGATLPRNYDYLFYKEINPPPPKQC